MRCDREVDQVRLLLKCVFGDWTGIANRKWWCNLMSTIDSLLKYKIMGLVRANDQATGQAMADAMVDAGIRAIEITFNYTLVR
jgi:hypothetical protein